MISRESVRAALHALADDDSYVESVWQLPGRTVLLAHGNFTQAKS